MSGILLIGIPLLDALLTYHLYSKSRKQNSTVPRKHITAKSENVVEVEHKFFAIKRIGNQVQFTYKGSDIVVKYSTGFYIIYFLISSELNLSIQDILYALSDSTYAKDNSYGNEESGSEECINEECDNNDGIENEFRIEYDPMTIADSDAVKEARKALEEYKKEELAINCLIEEKGTSEELERRLEEANRNINILQNYIMENYDRNTGRYDKKLDKQYKKDVDRINKSIRRSIKKIAEAELSKKGKFKLKTYDDINLKSLDEIETPLAYHLYDSINFNPYCYKNHKNIEWDVLDMSK